MPSLGSSQETLRLPPWGFRPRADPGTTSQMASSCSLRALTVVITAATANDKKAKIRVHNVPDHLAEISRNTTLIASRAPKSRPSSSPAENSAQKTKCMRWSTAPVAPKTKPATTPATTPRGTCRLAMCSSLPSRTRPMTAPEPMPTTKPQKIRSQAWMVFFLKLDAGGGSFEQLHGSQEPSSTERAGKRQRQSQPPTTSSSSADTAVAPRITRRAQHSVRRCWCAQDESSNTMVAITRVPQEHTPKTEATTTKDQEISSKGTWPASTSPSTKPMPLSSSRSSRSFRRWKPPMPCSASACTSETECRRRRRT
mmetsp:Transcript_139053/g.444056  ORF Transcript_139053/g.444056 Transcript_139053/m.444056 type:complete len:312 (+) Transcript_139053:743-1678(+)